MSNKTNDIISEYLVDMFGEGGAEEILDHYLPDGFPQDEPESEDQYKDAVGSTETGRGEMTEENRFDVEEGNILMA